MSSSPGSPTASAVLVAAGRSTRMSAGGGAEAARKPFLELGEKTVLERACEAFAAVDGVREIVLVGCAEDLDRIDAIVRGTAFGERVSARVAGGEERTDSVRNGVAAAAADTDVILVHDVARPLVRPARIGAVLALAARRGAALLAVRVRDTIKRSADGQSAEDTLDRSELWAAQTPQGFRAVQFRELLERSRREGFRPTDDAALYERYVGPVPLVEGDIDNLKLTSREDLALAEAILLAREREAVR